MSNNYFSNREINNIYRYDITEIKNRDIIARRAVQILVGKLHKIYPKNDIPNLLKNKDIFNNYYSDFIKREWTTERDNIKDLLDKHNKLIIKPIDGSCGKDIAVICNLYETYNKPLIYRKGKFIIEEYIKGCDYLQKYNNSSLNTIRVITIRHKENCNIFAAQFRIGVGKSCVDNCHKGGIYLKIDITNGNCIDFATDAWGNYYYTHPTSHLILSNIIIPKWNDILDFAKKAAFMTDNIITGWDIAVTEDYNLELIEGNSCPDFDMVQAPERKGCKKELYAALNNILNTNEIDYEKLIYENL